MDYYNRNSPSNFPIEAAQFRISLQGRDCFTFGGICSKDYGVLLEDVQVSSIPKRDVSFQSIPGRNGDFIMDNQRWANVKVQYTCFMASGLAGDYGKYVNELCCKSGYQRLEDTIYPDTFRMGAIAEPITPQVIGHSNLRFKVEFTCKPQRFLVDGEKVQIFHTSPAYITNPYPFPAYPLIDVFGTGSGSLIIRTNKVEILQIDHMLTLDCDHQDAYQYVGEYQTLNKNSWIRADYFPTLSPGQNRISWTGDIEGVHIKPRWYVL